MIVIEIRRYVKRSGIDVVGDWLANLEDLKARARIAARLDRLSLGNFGDCKALREGCPNSGSTWVQDIGCTTRCWAGHACFCCAAAVSAGSRPISKGQSII